MLFFLFVRFQAHSDILALMLQVFDEGRLTDGKGNTIHCPNAIFVMTSNLVQEEIRDALDSGYELRPRSSILDDLAKTTEHMTLVGGVTHTPQQPHMQQLPQLKGQQTQPQTQQVQVAPCVPTLPEPQEEEKQPSDNNEAEAMDVPTTTILPGAMPVTPMDTSAAPSSPDSAARHLSKLASDTERFLRFIVHPILKRAFHRDEFIGRINDIIVFHPFSNKDLQDTVQMELNRWAQRAKQR